MTTSVAVVGGGITGLTAAYYISLFLPTTEVILYERSSHLGGFLKTKVITSDAGHVRFELGPRTLRPAALDTLVVLDIVRRQELESQLALIPKKSPLAKNRFLFYPDRLNKLPSSILGLVTGLFTLPVLKGAFAAIFGEWFRRRRNTDVQDESVASFFRRRFGASITENVVSAVIHGIYAGSIERLSIRSVFPGLWKGEGECGSVIKSMIFGKNKEGVEDQILKAELEEVNKPLREKMKTVSMFSFQGGIEVLSKEMVKELGKRKNVTIRLDTAVQRIEFDEGSKTPMKVFTVDGVAEFSQVIAAIPAQALAPLLPTLSPGPQAALSSIPAVTVLVVNVFYSKPNLVPEGFGYLVPSSTPKETNPHGLLGCIFDSSDSAELTGTKLTLLFGGHYWDSRTIYPSKKEAEDITKETLKLQLGIDAKPDIISPILQRECIPQYTVGHTQRLQEVAQGLQETFSGNLSVAGASFRGIGVGSCMRSGWQVAMMVVRTGGGTGLEAAF